MASFPGSTFPYAENVIPTGSPECRNSIFSPSTLLFGKKKKDSPKMQGSRDTFLYKKKHLIAYPNSLRKNRAGLQIVFVQKNFQYCTFNIFYLCDWL